MNTKIIDKNGLDGDEMMKASKHIEYWLEMVDIHADKQQKRWLYENLIDLIFENLSYAEILKMHEYFDNKLTPVSLSSKERFTNPKKVLQ